MAVASKLGIVGRVTSTTLPVLDPTRINTDLPILYQYNINTANTGIDTVVNTYLPIL